MPQSHPRVILELPRAILAQGQGSWGGVLIHQSPLVTVWRLFSGSINYPTLLASPWESKMALYAKNKPSGKEMHMVTTGSDVHIDMIN